MASGDHNIDFGNDIDLEMKYREELYKNLLPAFTECIPALQFVDQPCISKYLNSGQMEEIRVRHQNDGSQAAARLLLEKLRKFPFFNSMLEAMDMESIRLSEFKPKFIAIRERVNKEWLEQHPPTPMPAVPLRAPTQASLETNPGRTRPDSGPPQSDFVLVANPEEGLTGLQIDAEPEDPGESSQDTYTNCSSTSDYETAESIRSEHPYEILRPSLQVDAEPMPMQETEATPQQAVREAVPLLCQPRQPRRIPECREEHPSLQRAISNNPVKNFGVESVRAELSALPGWSDLNKEQEVIHSMRCKRDMPGTYIIWYWKMAERPTLCIILNRKIVTFVMHKSSSQSGRFYINKRQKICKSLRELVDYHLIHGIIYTPPNGQATTVKLTIPYTTR